jgi:hypothetical protein
MILLLFLHLGRVAHPLVYIAAALGFMAMLLLILKLSSKKRRL